MGDDVATVLCCDCGVTVDASRNLTRCDNCIKSLYNISEHICKEVTLHHCRGCDRYHEPPSTWVTAAMESKEMLSLCLKKLRGLDKVKLLDANFLPTEPHSRRIRLSVKVSQAIDDTYEVKQEFPVEYVVAKEFCGDCHRIEAKDFWKATIQVRQKVDHKKTYYYLEQLMLKNNMSRFATNLKAQSSGMDMFFLNERDARKVVEFIAASVVCKHSISKKLISHDIKSNIYNSKYSTSVELAPVCKDSVVCLTSNMARSFGNISRLSVVLRSAAQIVLIDPQTAQIAYVNSLAYYKDPFEELCTTKLLKRFVVMEKEDIDVDYKAGVGQISQKHEMAEVWVQREAEVGSDDMIFCRTHLGKYLNIGDIVLGYDMAAYNLNNEEFDKLKESQVPDVILVKKFFGNKMLRNRRRKWKLKSLGVDDKNSQNKDYQDFLDDLEEDPQYRAGVNVYVNEAAPVVLEEEEEEGMPTIGVEEMLDELSIQDDSQLPKDEEPPAEMEE